MLEEIKRIDLYIQKSTFIIVTIFLIISGATEPRAAILDSTTTPYFNTSAFYHLWLPRTTKSQTSDLLLEYSFGSNLFSYSYSHSCVITLSNVVYENLASCTLNNHPAVLHLCIPLHAPSVQGSNKPYSLLVNITLCLNLLAPHIANHASTFRLLVRPKPKSVLPLINVETKVKIMENS